MVLAPHLLETDWQHQYSSTNQELFSLKIVLLKKNNAHVLWVQPGPPTLPTQSRQIENPCEPMNVSDMEAGWERRIRRYKQLRAKRHRLLAWLVCQGFWFCLCLEFQIIGCRWLMGLSGPVFWICLVLFPLLITTLTPWHLDISSVSPSSCHFKLNFQPIGDSFTMRESIVETLTRPAMPGLCFSCHFRNRNRRNCTWQGNEGCRANIVQL